MLIPRINWTSPPAQPIVAPIIGEGHRIVNTYYFPTLRRTAVSTSRRLGLLAAVGMFALALGGVYPIAALAHESKIHAAAAESARQAQQGAFYKFSVGDARVVALSDGTVPQDLHALLKGVSPSETDAILQREFMKNPVEASINAFVIDTGTRIVLVDTGAGAFFGPGNGGKLVDSLHSAGYSPIQITDVLLTHVHTDHSGGLVDAQGRMVFTRATIHVGQADLDFFLAAANQNGVAGYDKTYFQQATTSLSPYVKAGKVKGFKAAGEVVPNIDALPTPGHTPGHAFYVLQSKGQKLEFIGDILHVQAIQMARPDVTIVYDVELPAAESQRKKQFLRLAAESGMVAGAHLPFPGLGHLRQETSGFTYVPSDYRNRAASPQTRP